MMNGWCIQSQMSRYFVSCTFWLCKMWWWFWIAIEFQLNDKLNILGILIECVWLEIFIVLSVVWYIPDQVELYQKCFVFVVCNVLKLPTWLITFISYRYQFYESHSWQSKLGSYSSFYTIFVLQLVGAVMLCARLQWITKFALLIWVNFIQTKNMSDFSFYNLSQFVMCVKCL